MPKYFQSIKNRDPAARHPLQIILCYPGIRAIFWFRIAHFFYQCHLKLVGELIMYVVRRRTGIDIHPGAQIGKRLLIDHGSGVVIGETAIIGDDCTIYQGVTLGGTGKEKAKRHPTIGNRVMIGAGAKVLGNIYINDDVKIGANAVVLQSMEPHQTAIGVKAKILPKKEE